MKEFVWTDEEVAKLIATPDNLSKKEALALFPGATILSILYHRKKHKNNEWAKYKYNSLKRTSRWSEADMDVLASMRDKEVTETELKTAFKGRAKGAILMKAYKFNIKIKFRCDNSGRWRPEEVEKLKSLTGYEKEEEITALFPNRTLSAVANHALKHKVARANWMARTLSYHKKPKNPNYRRWTKEKILKLNDMDMGSPSLMTDVMAAFSITYSSADYALRAYAGLQYRSQRKRWTELEDDALKNAIQRQITKYVDLPNRSHGAIRQRLKVLGRTDPTLRGYRHLKRKKTT